jgi:signal transduction histidine kinase/ActR/RegA family two-component response regulator
MRLLEKDPGGTVRALRWLAVIGLLFPVLLFATAAWKDRAAILETAEGDGFKIIALFREQAGNLLTGHEIILDMIAARMVGHDAATFQFPSDFLHDLEVMDNRLDGASEIVIVDAAGRVRATTAHLQPNQPLPVADQRCFLTLSRNEAQSCISQPHSDPGSGHSLFSLSRRLEKDGAFNGTAQVAVSADYIVGLWASATPSLSDVVTLFGANGTILARSGPRSQAELSRQDVVKSLIGKISQSDAAIIGAPLSGDGADRITVYTKVADAPVYISLDLDRNAILAPWYANLTVYGLFAATATAGIMAALGLAIRRVKSERHAVRLWKAEVEQREKTQEQLRQSQKMEGLGQLTGGIAHDFNNLLMAVLGSLELLRKRLPPNDERAARLLSNAELGATRGAALTQRLLAFGRRQTLLPEPVDLSVLVLGMSDLLHSALGAGVTIETHVPIGLPPVLVDANQLELALLNLAGNARDAMSGSGRLTIAARGEPDAAGRYVVLSITDTGTGMDHATLARATEPFFTTKGIGKGTGLGLSMVHGLAGQSGGKLLLRSAPGEGTTAELWLPRTEAAPAPAEQPGARVTEHSLEPARPRTVLVVDDDPLVLASTVAMLEDMGHAAMQAASGRQALDILRAGARVDLVVSDQTMPGMTGLQLAAELRRLQPGLPLLLATGYAERSDVLESGLPILAKPYDQAALAKATGEQFKGSAGDARPGHVHFENHPRETTNHTPPIDAVWRETSSSHPARPGFHDILMTQGATAPN